jgi:hypothetical protein
MLFDGSHVIKILSQGPWNIRGSLLILKLWPPNLSFDEVKLITCQFWVQIHGPPLQNMTTRNAIQIGKSLGNLLDAENGNSEGIICTHHLRIRVEIDTSKPLVPGLLLPRQGRSQIWVQYMYERLADYCTLCGLIGHHKNYCPASPPSGPQDKYGLSLCAYVISGSWVPATSPDAPPLVHMALESVSTQLFPVPSGPSSALITVRGSPRQLVLQGMQPKLAVEASSHLEISGTSSPPQGLQHVSTFIISA